MPALLALVTVLGQPPQARLMEPATWTEDFGTHTLNGFFSYPATTDTAYDFTIFPHRLIRQHELVGSLWSSGEILRPVGIPAPSGRPDDSYLVRSLQPLGGSTQRIGVGVKPVHFFSAEDSHLSFDYFMPPTLSPVTLHVEVAGSDGLLYRAEVERGPAGQWHRAALRGADLLGPVGQPLPGGIGIEQFCIITHPQFPRPHTTYFLALDNVALKGHVPVRFEVTSPVATRYRHWPLDMIHRVYQPGEVLELRLGPTPAPVTMVTATIHGYRGERLAELGALEPSGSGWRLPQGYRLGATLPAAPLELRLEGRGREGEVLMRQGLRLWVLKPARRERPRLFFTAESLDQLRAEAASGDHEHYQGIRASALSDRAEPIPARADFEPLYEDYLLRDFLGYFKAVRGSSTRILNNAWVYAMEQDAEAGEYAREGLLKLSQWDFMTHPWFRKQGRESYYVVGQAAIRLGLAFDLLGPLLTEEERQSIRAGLIRNCVAPTYREYFVDNRVPNHTSNWIGGAVGGNALLMLALVDPATLEFTPPGEPALFPGLMEKLLAFYRHSFLSDGSYGEGYGYQRFAMVKSLSTWAALDSLFGLDPDMLDALHLRGTYRYVIASTIDRNLRLSMGDSNSSVYPVDELSWLIHRFGDPVDAWFKALNPGRGWKSFIWGADDPGPRSPGKAGWAPTQWFPEKGSAILRNGWEAESTVVHFRAGPNFNHTHIDQGHFLLASHGELLAGEGGLSSYYDDPYYWTYFVQPAAHNVLLVDGNPLSQEIADFRNEVAALDNYPRMQTTLSHEKLSMVSAELGMVYRSTLAGYQRTLVLLPSGLTLVHDRVRTDGEPRELQFLYHPPRGHEREGTHDTDFEGAETTTHDGDLTLNQDGLSFAGNRARLDLAVHFPRKFVMETADRPVPYRERLDFPEVPLTPPQVVTIGTPGPVPRVDFLITFQPGPIDSPPGPRPRRVSRGESFGVEVSAADGTGYVYLSSRGAIIEHEGLRAEADSLLVVKESGEICRLLVNQAREVTLGGQRIHASENPISLRLERNGGQWTVREQDAQQPRP